MKSPRPPSRAHRPPAGVAVLASLAALVAWGCADANRQFTGVWRAPTPLTASWFDGRPELALGHFGREMTGIVRLLDAAGLPDASCPCAYLDQRALSVDDATFTLSAELCDRGVWVFEGELDDAGPDPVLTLTFYAAATPGDRLITVLTQESDFVTDDYRECTP